MFHLLYINFAIGTRLAWFRELYYLWKDDCWKTENTWRKNNVWYSYWKEALIKPYWMLYALANCTFSESITWYILFSGSNVNVGVALEREDEVAGPVIAPLFPQVSGFTQLPFTYYLMRTVHLQYYWIHFVSIDWIFILLVNLEC